MKTLTKVFSVWCCSLLMVTLAFSTDNTEEKLRLEQERLDQKNAGIPAVQINTDSHEDCTEEHSGNTLKPMTVDVPQPGDNITVPPEGYVDQEGIDRRAHIEA